MKVKIFQINLKRDKKAVAFESYDRICGNVDADIYDIVYSGEANKEPLPLSPLTVPEYKSSSKNYA